MATRTLTRDGSHVYLTLASTGGVWECPIDFESEAILEGWVFADGPPGVPVGSPPLTRAEADGRYDPLGINLLDLDSKTAQLAATGSGSITETVLKSGYSRRRKYDVRDYLGSDDIGAAINRAIAAAAADGYAYGKPGQVVLPPMNAAQTTEIVPGDGVDVFGAGAGKTVLRPQGIISSVHRIGSAGAPLRDIHLAGFEIDGSQQTLNNGAYATGTKGIFTQYHVRVTMEGLYIHDTAASGLGSDFWDASVIRDVVAWGCGRFNGGNNPGGAGIGIGTGGWAIEALQVDNVDCRNNGRFGLFFERQTTTRSYGSNVSKAYAKGNPIGFSDAGMGGVDWSQCVADANTLDGFSLDGGTVGNGSPGRYGNFVSCTSKNNTRHGFIWDGSGNTAGLAAVELQGLRALSNGGDGARFVAGSTLDALGITVRGGRYESNGGSGISVMSTGTRKWSDVKIIGATAKNNGTNAGASNRDGIALLCALSKATIADNICYDDQGTPTQQYGISTGAGAAHSAVDIRGNQLNGNAVGAANPQATMSAGTGWRRNPGYNPRGPVSEAAVTASPYTYTNAGTSPGMLYVVGGTVSLIAKGGINVATTTNQSVWLEPGEAAVITYTTAPTLKMDRF